MNLGSVGRGSRRAAVRVLICPDKFKGTLTATAAAEAIAAGWREARPNDVLDLLPISDGGDGFGALLGHHLGAREQTCDTVDAAHRPVRASWWWIPRPRVAIVESARIIGLAMLPPGRFHPVDLDTFGLGVVLRQVGACRPRTILVGIGGSATNDAGFGMARALGWRFLDAGGNAITRWPELARLERIVGFSSAYRPGAITVAVDVENPLLGPTGSTRVYGPQKGLRPQDFLPAERALQRVIDVLRNQRRPEARGATRAGAGAAGGLGFGLGAFLRATLEPGFDIFARATGFQARMRDAGVVVTGEGAIDTTTVRMGKGVGRVARLCRQVRKPCLGLAGLVQLAGRSVAPFTRVFGIAPGLTSADEARAQAARWLTVLARQAATAWNHEPSGSSCQPAVQPRDPYRPRHGR
jgi:glycerate 2-kinase